MTCGYRITLFALAATIGCRGDFYPSEDDTGSDTGSEAGPSSEDNDSDSTGDGDTTHGADDGGSSGEETTEPGTSTEGSTTEEETTDTSDSNTDPTTETDSPTDDPTGTEDPTGTDTPTDSSSTSDVGPLGPDQPCHPLWEDAGTPPCGNALTCAYMGWDPNYDSYQWLCKIYTGDDPGGESEDPCYEYTSCKTGFICLDDALWPDGMCDSADCCTEYCDVQNDTCPGEMFCKPSANEPGQYPEQIRNSSIPLVGYCTIY